MASSATAEFTQSEIEEFKRVFQSLDENGDQFIDQKELTLALKNLGLYQSEKQVTDLIKEVDKNHNGTVEFHEFLDVILNIRLGKANANHGFALVYTKQKDLISFKGHTGLHSFSEEEMGAFSEHFNHSLSDDADCKHLLPIDSEGKSLDLCKKVRDGILLCKFINVAVKGTIDPRSINMRKGGKDIDVFKMQENQTLALKSAQGIGVKVTNMGASELMKGEENPHIVLGLVWQLVKIHLLNSINLKNHPELVRLLEDGETLEDLLKLPPDMILLRWFNYHLKNAGHPKRVKNFSGDVKDSEAYTVLLHQISPNTCSKDALNKSDMNARAADVISNAKKLDVKVFVKPRDIVSGNPRLNLIFTAAIFNQCPGLDPLSQEEMSKVGLMEDDVGDSREERAFRMWINSLGLDNGELYINNLFEDCTDGLVLLKVMDHIKPGCVNWKSVEKNPSNRFKKLSNCNLAVTIGKNDLKFSLVNIGGQDLVDKNKKLLLGLVWQMMRAHTLKFLAEVQKKKFGNREVTDQDLIDWANQKVASSGKSSKIESFKDKSIASGHFCLELVAALEPRIIDWELVTAGSSEEERLLNARYAISIARKLGATIFLLPEDIVEVKPKMILTFVASIAALEK